MPNLMGHKDQSEAAIQVHEFIPLVEIGCSKNLKFFLCSLYAPMCTEQIDIPIPSCQSICEEVKSKCLPVLQQFNFNWPHMLNCSRLPVPEKNGLCMEVPNITDAKGQKHHVSSYISSSSSSSMAAKHFNTDKPLSEKDSKAVLNSLESMYPFLYPPRRNEINSQSSQHSPQSKPAISLESFGISANTLNSDNIYGNGNPSKGGNKCYPEFVYIPIAGKSFNHTEAACAPKCGKDILFTRNDKNFVEIWMCIWASICFMSTLFTVLTFWIDPSRFRYPEKPIIFLSMCFCISSVAYLIRIYAGSEFVSCDKSDSGEYHITLEGLENSGCIIVFLLLYYFGMAASMWWVILTITWYLAAGKKWGHEAIESKASLFHLLAWATPAILTIIVLTLRHVDGDELTGLCYVGSQDPNALLYFVIIPLCVFAAFGDFVLALGFVSLSRIRSVMRFDGHNTNKLERLMVRIGVFTTFYTLPALCVIGCHVYEYKLSSKWKETAIDRSRVCQDTNSMSSCRLNESIPLKEIFVLKIFMSLVLGISTGIWVWSNKTWSSWTLFCQSTFCIRKRRNFKCPTALHNSSYIHVGPHIGTSSVVSAATTQFHHLSQQQLYHHSYASLKNQRHQHRSHHKRRNEVTHV
jgi:frizzled protein 9/10